ncbi:methylglyoxal synthase [Elusimicrobium posterum]|uniref:methylglyoxal synthase n=1 Tax=Elusimicrobium posterum TaxID=3116653 RepID=UPI003C728DF5
MTVRASIPARKSIALVAHDNRKRDLIEWVMYNKGSLQKHTLYATGTTGGLIEEALDMKVHLFKSGPYGGDQQIGAKISEQQIDLLVFFWDPLTQQPHDPDIKALLRLAVLWNIPMACNRATADYLISSPMMNTEYSRQIPDLSRYMDRLKK